MQFRFKTCFFLLHTFHITRSKKSRARLATVPKVGSCKFIFNDYISYNLYIYMCNESSLFRVLQLLYNKQTISLGISFHIINHSAHISCGKAQQIINSVMQMIPYERWVNYKTFKVIKVYNLQTTSSHSLEFLSYRFLWSNPIFIATFVGPRR